MALISFGSPKRYRISIEIYRKERISKRLGLPEEAELIVTPAEFEQLAFEMAKCTGFRLVDRQEYRELIEHYEELGRFWDDHAELGERWANAAAKPRLPQDTDRRRLIPGDLGGCLTEDKDGQ